MPTIRFNTGEVVGPPEGVWGISIEAWREKAKKYRQIVAYEGRLHYLDLPSATFKPVEPSEYQWYIKRKEEVPFLTVVDEIHTYHDTGHAYTFKPSILEVICCIPETEEYKDVVAFEIVQSPGMMGAVKKKVARSVGWNVALTRLYRRPVETEGCIDGYLRVPSDNEDTFHFLGGDIDSPRGRIFKM